MIQNNPKMLLRIFDSQLRLPQGTGLQIYRQKFGWRIFWETLTIMLNRT